MWLPQPHHRHPPGAKSDKENLWLAPTLAEQRAVAAAPSGDALKPPPTAAAGSSRGGPSSDPPTPLHRPPPQQHQQRKREREAERPLSAAAVTAAAWSDPPHDEGRQSLWAHASAEIRSLEGKLSHGQHPSDCTHAAIGGLCRGGRGVSGAGARTLTGDVHQKGRVCSSRPSSACSSRSDSPARSDHSGVSIRVRASSPVRRPRSPAKGSGPPGDRNHTPQQLQQPPAQPPARHPPTGPGTLAHPGVDRQLPGAVNPWDSAASWLPPAGGRGNARSRLEMRQFQTEQAHQSQVYLQQRLQQQQQQQPDAAQKGQQSAGAAPAPPGTSGADEGAHGAAQQQQQQHTIPQHASMTGGQQQGSQPLPPMPPISSAASAPWRQHPQEQQRGQRQNLDPHLSLSASLFGGGSQTQESALDAIRRQRAESSAAKEALEKLRAETEAEAARLKTLSAELAGKEGELDLREAELAAALERLQVRRQPRVHSPVRVHLLTLMFEWSVQQ